MTDCVFCKIVARQEPVEIVYEDDLCLAFLDRYPQARGHLQLIPKKHYRWIYDVPFMDELFATAQKIIKAVLPVLGADHATIATFGHAVPHAHLWIVPQYDQGQIPREWDGRKDGKDDLSRIAEILRRALSSSIT